jgi:NAD(P)H-flavin reductase/ferredoxin
MEGKVTILPFGETLDVHEGESLLKAILRQGRFVKYGCKHGGCNTCRAQHIDGDCRLSDNTSFSLTDADRDAGIVLLCSAYAEGCEVVVDLTDTMDDLTEDLYKAGQQVSDFEATIDRLDPLTHDIRWLGLKLPDGATMRFTAGQYLEVAVPGSDDEWRSYSFANPPSQNDRVDLIIKSIPGGRFSSFLEGPLQVGDQLRVRGPFGQFGVRLSHRPMVMIAGGSGMAPILSILNDLVETGVKRPVTFFYGARSDRDLFLLEELNALAAQYDWFTFVPALSEPHGNQGEWSGETGMVTEALGRLVPATKGYEGYLCGPPPMIDAAIDVLVDSGCKERHVYFDRFVPSG